MGAYGGYWCRWLLAAALLAISGGVSIAPPPERAGSVGTRAAADTPRHERIVNRIAGGDLRAAIDQAHKIDWAALFHALGTNYFAFIAQAAPSAYQGEGAAQYYIGRALGRCEETNALYRDSDDPDQAVSHLAMVPALRERERQELLDCRQLLTGTPFKTLPARSGGYPAEYWKSRAIDSRYPAALVAATLKSPIPSAVQNLADALATGEADAMLLFGWARVENANAEEPAAILGAAWVLAACSSGPANCESTGDALSFAICKPEIESGCIERFSAADELSARLSARDLEQAHRLALEILTDLKSHEPSRLIRHLSL